MGMRHLLIRFLTLPYPALARRSAVITAILVAMLLVILLFAVDPGALAHVKGEND